MWDGSEGRPVGESLLWCANWVCEWFSLDEMLGPCYWVSSTAQTMFSVSKEIQTHPKFSSDDGGVPIPFNKKPIGNPRSQWESFIMLNLHQHGRIFKQPILCLTTLCGSPSTHRSSAPSCQVPKVQIQEVVRHDASSAFRGFMLIRKLLTKLAIYTLHTQAHYRLFGILFVAFYPPKSLWYA